MVASDRISTYDAVHPTPIPDKGRVLTGLSVLWFGLTRDIVPNHFVSATDGVPAELRGRALRVRRLKMLPVECIVRGYITGLGLEGLPGHRHASRASSCRTGLQESEQLPEPIYTPSTKAEEGHDEAIDFDETVAAAWAREELAAQLRDVSIAVYYAVAAHARERGVILADTKFEFGLDADGVLTLGDEVCTPDSSRFWPADTYEVGRGQPSFDKQYVRDWATSTGWDKTPPAPPIPDDVVAQTRERYVTAYERLAGEPFGAWLDRVALRVRVLIRPKAGILDPQGQAVERALPALGLRGRGERARRPAGRARRRRTPSQVPAMCEKLLANPLIEDYEIQ